MEIKLFLIEIRFRSVVGFDRRPPASRGTSTSSPTNRTSAFDRPCPPGTTSISSALVLAAPGPAADGVGYSVDLDSGDPAEILDVVPSSAAVANRPDLVFYRFGMLLKDQGREISTIEFSPRPTGLAPTSNIIGMNFRDAPIEGDDDSTQGRRDLIQRRTNLVDTP